MSPAALELTVDGQPVASSTRELAAGPYTVVIATAIPELALRLHSTYIGSEHSDSIVVHLELGLNNGRLPSAAIRTASSPSCTLATGACSSTPATSSSWSPTSRRSRHHPRKIQRLVFVVTR